MPSARAPCGRARARPDPAKLARELETTPFAWIVFETESARDAAVRRVQAEGGVAWRGATLRLETKELHVPRIISSR